MCRTSASSSLASAASAAGNSPLLISARAHEARTQAQARTNVTPAGHRQTALHIRTPVLPRERTTTLTHLLHCPALQQFLRICGRLSRRCDLHGRHHGFHALLAQLLQALPLSLVHDERASVVGRTVHAGKSCRGVHVPWHASNAGTCGILFAILQNRKMLARMVEHETSFWLGAVAACTFQLAKFGSQNPRCTNSFCTYE
jgi:hypothetical protein